MITETTLIVMSTREPPNHDSGSWTRHEEFNDAAILAHQIGGTIWEKTDRDGDVTMKQLARPDRDEIKKMVEERGF